MNADPRLGPKNTRCVRSLFPEGRHAQAERLLTNHCGNNLPFCEDKDEDGLERIRLAALHVSGGDYNKLCEAVRLARLDWRDLLAAAEEKQEHK